MKKLMNVTQPPNTSPNFPKNFTKHRIGEARVCRPIAYSITSNGIDHVNKQIDHMMKKQAAP